MNDKEAKDATAGRQARDKKMIAFQGTCVMMTMHCAEPLYLYEL